MKFNINDKVRVRLTDLGRKTLAVLRAKQNEDMVTAYGPGIPLQPITVPEVDGWSKWQLWDLMATFGPYLGNGLPLVFETEIDLVCPDCNGTGAVPVGDCMENLEPSPCPVCTGPCT